MTVTVSASWSRTSFQRIYCSYQIPLKQYFKFCFQIGFTLSTTTMLKVMCEMFLCVCVFSQSEFTSFWSETNTLDSIFHWRGKGLTHLPLRGSGLTSVLVWWHHSGIIHGRERIRLPGSPMPHWQPWPPIPLSNLNVLVCHLGQKCFQWTIIYSSVYHVSVR